jgi:hypothetical protein
MLLIFSPGLVARNALAVVPGDIKTSVDADKHRPEIAAAIKPLVSDLGGDDPVKRKNAREALILEVNAPGASGQFFDTYAQEINAQLKPLATNPDPKIRLNVAIVVARIAEKVDLDSTRLFDVTDMLLNDKSVAVVDWALKAARYVLPPILQTGVPQQQRKLLDDIKQHANNPQLLSLVYEALSLNYSGVKANDPGWDKKVKSALPELLEVVRNRIDLYAKQVPAEPAAIGPAIAFLASSQVWKQATPAQQVQIIQALSDLMYLAAHRGAVATGPERDQTAMAATMAGRGLAALALIAGQPGLSKEIEALANNPTNSATLPQIDQLSAKLKAIPAWGSVQSPPKLEGGATTSSAPTTAPAK